MDKLLSVIITVYNEKKYVGQCIESVIAQTYKNIEIIVVDDGSTDNSLLVCKDYAKRDSRVVIIQKENGGPMSARKAGIKAAKGDYITYVDGDDWLESDLYEKVMNRIEDADICAYGLTCVYEDIEGYVIGDKIPDNIKQDIMTNSAASGIYEGVQLDTLKSKSLYFGELGKFGILPSMCSKVFKKSIIEQNLYDVDDDVRMGDDGCCTFPSICDSQKLVIDNDITGYCYRKTVSDSITTGYSFKEFERIEKVYNTLHKAFSNRNAEYMYSQLTYYLAFLFRNEMVLELSNLRLSGIFEKYTHLKIASKLKWIEYVINTCDKSQLDGDTALFVSNIKNPSVLMVKWYSRRIIK